MHNIKLIRKDPNYFAKKFKDRNINIDLKTLLNLDKDNRELIQKKEKLEQEKKIITKKKDESKFLRSKEISNEIGKIEDSLLKIQKDIDLILLYDSLRNHTKNYALSLSFNCGICHIFKSLKYSTPYSSKCL